MKFSLGFTLIHLNTCGLRWIACFRLFRLVGVLTEQRWLVWSRVSRSHPVLSCYLKKKKISCAELLSCACCMYYLGSLVLSTRMTRVHVCWITCHSGLCLVREFWKFDYCSTFVFIWQLVFNHGLIRLKTFVSQFPTKLYN